MTEQALDEYTDQVGTPSVTLRIRNSCHHTIWPAIVSKSHSPELISENTTGFALQPGESKTVSVPPNWAGTLWGRTHCRKNATGKFICGTGDCGSFALECPGGATAPAATTLADFTPTGSAGDYAYFISLEKGFNLALAVVPGGDNRGGVESGSNCRATGCVADLNKECPKELEVVNGNDVVIGCNSACEAFKESRDHYCGRPSTYSDHFKRFCPHAQAFENDKTSITTFECSSTDYYDVNFCASSFPSSPPPPTSSSIPNSQDVYDPGKELTDNSGTRIPLVVKILIGILGPLGIGLFLYLGYVLWSSWDQNSSCYKPKFDCPCCNNWVFCNCCNPSSNPDRHHHGTSVVSTRDDQSSISKRNKQVRKMEMERV